MESMMNTSPVSVDVPAIELSHFSFSYPGARPVIESVDWHVAQGEFVLLTGDTGSGKTTLLRNMKPEIAPSGTRGGEVRVLGEPLVFGTSHAFTSQVGYVFQSPENQMVCDTVWHELAFALENLGCEPDEMRRRVAEVAYFFGIEPWLDRKTAALSGGQKQTVNLAAVLALRPRILLLDEPTAQLDPIAEKNFLHELFRINRELGITVVLSTHNPITVADYATLAYRVSDGAVRQTPLPEPGLCIPITYRSVDEGAYGAAPLALESREVFFRYERNEDFVLRGTSLQVKRAGVHAIVGGNGSGKTTLLTLLAGARKPERGHIENAFLSEEALLPQDPKALFVCDSVVEELAEWKPRCGYDDGVISDMIARMKLSGLEEHHPYDLSGGQQQKLALAKLLLTRPRLLLLDEPTKGLDAQSRLELARMIESQRDEGVTTVFITHDLSFAARLADRISLLFDGDITVTQSAADFFSDNLFYRPLSDGFAQLFEEEGRA